MISKEQFVNSVKHEYRIIRHVFANLPEGCDDWRPSPQQRSVIELMKYIAYCGSGAAFACRDQNFDRFSAKAEELKDLDRDGFIAALDTDEQNLLAVVDEFTNEDFLNRRVKLPIGEVGLGEGMINMVLKILACYRLQFFVYAKACGASQLGTADAWVGISHDAFMAMLQGQSA